MTNKYNLRVTLTSPAGSLVITEPQGTQEAPLTLIRDKIYKSVLEGFDTPLTFVLRAVDFINQAKALGIDTLLTMLVEVSDDFGTTWENFVEGVLDLPAISSVSDPKEYKVKLSCKKDDVWVKLLSRQSTDIDVQSLLDLDGNAIAASALLDIVLPTQVVRRVCRTEMWNSTDDGFVDQYYEWFTAASYVPSIDLPKSILNEIETKYNYPPSLVLTSVDSNLFPMIEAKETATAYDIDISIVLCKDPAYKYQMAHSGTPGDEVIIAFARVDNAGTRVNIPFTITQLGVDGVDGRTVYTYSGTELNILKGTNIFTYSQNSISNKVGYIVPNDKYAEKSFFNVLAHTTFPPSVTKAIRVGEGFDAITRRITGGNNFYSDFFSTGCGKNFVNMLGLHLRGYDFTTKPFTDNLLERFKAADAVWGIGLGYEKVAGVLKVRVEEVGHFFDSSSNSVELSGVTNYTSTFKPDSISNAIEIGYNKWQLTAGGSLIDDPQTQHVYSTPFKYVGKKITIFCTWIAASLLFELTRRAIEKLTDTFDTDNDKFLLAINEANEAKVTYVAATNLNDPALRYNKEITPGRNFLRWLKTLNVGAGQYVGQFFNFVSGLGNFRASIQIAPDGCAGSDVATVTEDSNIAITAAVLHGIDVITIKGFPLNWDQYKLIRESPNKSIGISRTTDNHVPYFIDQIDFYLFERKANLTLFRYQ